MLPQSLSSQYSDGNSRFRFGHLTNVRCGARRGSAKLSTPVPRFSLGNVMTRDNFMKQFRRTTSGTRLSAAVAFGIALVACVGWIPQAQAQFVCVGNTAGATVGPATASGAGSTAAGSAINVACGSNADASGLNSFNTAMGNNASAAGAGSFNAAYGAESNASGAGSTNTAMGENAHAEGAGSGNTATGNTALALGAGSFNTATGFQSNATGDGSRNTAIGVAANAAGNSAANTAVGSSATATGLNSSAFGSGASATFANSAAFGTNATVTRANQQVFGTATSTYTLPGVSSAASLAAQSGPVKVVTSDAQGNLATASFAPQDISTLQSNVSALQQNVSVLQQQMKQGFEVTAIAIAMGGAALPSDKRFAISTNWGNFRGQNAVGVAAQFRLTNYAVANVGVGGGFAQGGIGSRAGVTFAW
jgi:hypothetical protein